MMKALLLILLTSVVLFATDLDKDGIDDTSDSILRHPHIDQTNGKSIHIGEYTLNLKTGWSMQSLPVDTILRPDIIDFTFTNEKNEFSDIYVDRYTNFKVFGNYKIIWQYIDGNWKVYSEDEEIRNQIISSGYPLIEQLDKNHAFWILMEEDRIVTFYGKEFILDPEQYKPNSWHMIKYGGHTTNEEKQILGIDITWEYLNGTWIKDAENLHGTTWIKRDSSVLSDASKLYFQGLIAYSNGEYSTAKLKYLEAESLGFIQAKSELGSLYFHGDGVTKDYIIAKQYFEDSIDSIYSKNALGYMYGNGYGVDKDYTIAKQYFDEIVLDNNSSISLNNLGYLYEYGYGVPQDYAKAFEYFTKASNIYSTQATDNLADLYMYGKGVDKDINKAKELYINSANKNNKNAQFQIGNLYYKGDCFNQDYTQAKKWFEKSAFTGNNANAYNMLGTQYKNSYGVSQDYSKSIEYYTKAMEINPASYGTTNLGYMYIEGKGVSQNYSKAVELLQLSADNENKSGQANLANMYYLGKGITQDYIKAFELYKKAADQNINWAQNMVGVMYLNGYGVIQNFNTALEWFIKAEENGDTDAMTWIGIYNEYGIGNTLKNEYTAYTWYVKAAANGNRWSQNKMAELYYMGTGITKDITKSYCWLKLSSDNGYETATDNLNNIDWSSIVIPSDCSIIDTEINTYKIVEEEKIQCD